MKTRESLIRYRKWQVDEQRRKLGDLYAVAEDLERQAEQLEIRLAVEQDESSRSKDAAFIYPAFAQQMINRRDNIRKSRQEIEVEIVSSKEVLTSMFQELKKIEILEQRRVDDERADELRRDGQQLDELAINRHQRAD